jgi:hypothetical protein
MSNSNSSVGYHIESYSQESGAAWNAVGASTPTTYYGGNNYTFYFVNNTQDTDTTTAVFFDYDLSSLLPQQTASGGYVSPACESGNLVFLTDASSSVSGTVAPGSTISIQLATGTTDETDNDAGEMSLQAGAAPLITNLTGDGYQVCFWFFTDGDGGAVSKQQIAICDTDNDTTLPISSFTTNTSSEQVAESTAAGISVTLNGGGNSLNTNNIYIQICNA